MMEPEKFGAVRFSPSNKSFHYFVYPTDNSLYRFIGDRFKIFEDNNANVWVNMKGGGFLYYNAVKEFIAYLLNTVDNGSYHLPEVVFNLFYEKAGHIMVEDKQARTGKDCFSGQ